MAKTAYDEFQNRWVRLSQTIANGKVKTVMAAASTASA
jgi:hypothetical protein